MPSCAEWGSTGLRQPGLGLPAWDQTGGAADPTYCVPSKAINFSPESHLVPNTAPWPQTVSPILELLQGPAVWAQEELGTQGLWKSKSLWALRSLQWRTLKSSQGAPSCLERLGPPPLAAGRLEVA